MTQNAAQSISAFHVMAKPTGAKCNLDCAYCFFLKKEKLFPGSSFRMSDEVMENYIRQTIEAHQVPEVTIAWQGGEPTMMGIDFFRRAVEVEKRYLRPGMRIENTLQTNGVLINEEWCRFLHENNFLVGISVDGPRQLHDAFRYDKGGNSVFDRVVRSVRLMHEHGVEFNILSTVNSANAREPLAVYRFFRDDLKARYIQFIPIVERDNDTGHQEGLRITHRSVGSEQWGNFLIEIFDEWVRRDVGKTFVLFFDAVLASYVRGYSTICVLQPTCGQAVALEHTGDLYSCDHFVEPKHWLGNINNDPVGALVNSQKQKSFGQDKANTLPQYCRQCEFLFTCHGECPKNRVLRTPDGEPGLNWLCAGLKKFFGHTKWHMELMAKLLQAGQPADLIMEAVALKKKKETQMLTAIGRNQPCFCGSGVKFKKCHGK